jgi:hypothetical protein
MKNLFHLIAVQKKEARVSQVIKDVRLIPSGASPRPASVNDYVSTGMAVRTGTDSRTELRAPRHGRYVRRPATAALNSGEKAK